VKIYVQVCLQLTDQSTANREFGNLLLIKDNYPKSRAILALRKSDEAKCEEVKLRLLRPVDHCVIGGKITW